MWKFLPNDEFIKRVERWPKKYRRELAAMTANLHTVYEALRNGAKIEHVRFGFLHAEPMGVLAITQNGGGAGLKATRLYVYPHKEKEHLHAITVGDKSSQSADIAYCKVFVSGILSEG